jgi:hypothetical protein
MVDPNDHTTNIGNFTNALFDPCPAAISVFCNAKNLETFVVAKMSTKELICLIFANSFRST